MQAASRVFSSDLAPDSPKHELQSMAFGFFLIAVLPLVLYFKRSQRLEPVPKRHEVALSAPRLPAQLQGPRTKAHAQLPGSVSLAIYRTPVVRHS